MIDISSLNENQKEAVLSEDKYIRVIAGAGSGKTRVLTYKIAYICIYVKYIFKHKIKIIFILFNFNRSKTF